ncbi:hypothetical protein [Leptolyngbya sp. FACHB-261]|uniref:hypothetical protein n=1 Tax=Leptolyngbya sp. FACHB-261 TaxID=2692806 RepID=UPI001684FC55|nr:hypothetical protein [Leptolyngbya sp. FACHB-261]MBD2101432.1 hypothetical protein [Leptolyngbya sp. FACHB-261]
MTDPQIALINLAAGGKCNIDHHWPFFRGRAGRGYLLRRFAACGRIASSLKPTKLAHKRFLEASAMHLTQVLQPQLCISLAQIAQFLGIPQSLICRIEHWPHQLFVHRADRGGQFISYRVFAAWADACARSIQSCTDSRVLDWLGQVIRQECQRFSYPKVVVDHWRCLWLQRQAELKLQASSSVLICTGLQ